MTDDLVRQLREVGGLDPAAELCSYAADRIEHLERELSEERASREQAAAKAWEFSDRIKELESQVGRLRSAMDDIVSYVSRADYYYMEPQTLDVLREINGR